MESYGVPRGVAPSAGVVLSSLFILSALGLGAFLLMYSMVHRGDVPMVQLPTIGAVAPQAESPLASALAPSPAPAPPPVTLAPLGGATPADSAATTSVALTPLPEALAPVAAPAKPTPGATVSVGPAQADLAAARAATVVRIEPNPVSNPYEHAAARAPSDEQVATPEANAAKPDDTEPTTGADTNPYDVPAADRAPSP